jgi:hypothetical protein
MTRIIEATLAQGLRFAGSDRGLRVQLPLIAREFPEVRDCHPASINLQLDEPLRINHPDFTTPPIPWVAGRPDVTERFGFLSVQFEYPINAPLYRAWIYDPHGSPHRSNLFSAEIIAEHIPGVAYGDRCRLHLARATEVSVLIV